MRKPYIFAIAMFCCVLSYFSLPLLKGGLPIPADTIVGLYYPFRDLYAKDFPRGLPFKNSLITDPVRQQYPWRLLAIEKLIHWQLPLWNPYSFSGTPLLANFQTALFYPLNVFFFILPFPYFWSIGVIVQPLLAGVFLFFYLRNLRLHVLASVLAAMAFSLSGFSIAWLEWNTVMQTALWLPMVLLGVDKIFSYAKNNQVMNYELRVIRLNEQKQKVIIWSALLLVALVSAFFAGHLQTFFYLFVVTILYIIVRWIQGSKNKNTFILFLIIISLFALITSVQWVPTLVFIQHSARDIDFNWQGQGWFIPWQHLIQFIAPDFFGNPTTLNYWGVWNYGEFVGYIGILPLIMAIFALSFRYDKKTLFFGFLFFVSLIFSLPTFFAKLPFVLNIPFLATTQPTRLLFITDFSLAVLAGLGLDYYLKRKDKMLFIVGLMGIIYVLLWYVVLFAGASFFHISIENMLIAKRNMYLPTILFIGISIVLVANFKLSKRLAELSLVLLMVVTLLELLRFTGKFLPFAKSEYLFPNTKSISFLQKQKGLFRIMTTDSRIFPPNFSVKYKLQSIDGYDPLYLRRYGELIAASERGEPNIDAPFGFNRIITPHITSSKIIDLLGVRYILSLSDISSPTVKKVFSEGQTSIYQNTQAFPRFFLVDSIIRTSVKEQTIKKLFENSDLLHKTAIVESQINIGNLICPCDSGRISIDEYSENVVKIGVQTDTNGFLVMTDPYYPTWHAMIDGKETSIYLTDYAFRGIFVPKGEHQVIFFISLL